MYRMKIGVICLMYIYNDKTMVIYSSSDDDEDEYGGGGNMCT